MIVYKHTIWLRKLQGLGETIGIHRIQSILILLVLFFVMFVSALKIINSINNGIQTQKKADKISADLKELEKEHKNLKFVESFSKSDEEKESQIRSLGDKKKEGEVLYILSSLNRDKETILAEKPAETQPQVQNKPKLSNWEKWVRKIF